MSIQTTRAPATTESGLKVSEDLFVIPDNRHFILYEPQKPSALLVNKAAIQALQKLSNQNLSELDLDPAFVTKLLDAGIILRKNEIRRPLSFNTEPAGFDPAGISLFLTTRCSMRCIYCYSNGGINKKLMLWPIARAGIDWIIEHTKKQKRKKLFLNFHGGGEVSTALPLMKKCVDYARSKSSAHRMSIRIEAGLNGIMSTKTVTWITRNLDGATVSLDGLPEIQNAQRPLANGKDSFPLVSRTLHRMDASGFNYGIRTTITREHLPKLADAVQFMAQTFSAKTIQIEPIFIVGRALEKDLTPIDPLIFISEYRKALARARDYEKNLKYSGARFQVKTNTFCKAATGNSLGLTPEGYITACYEVTELEDSRSSLFFYGRFDQRDREFRFDFDKIRMLRSLHVGNKSFCQKCFCKWHCAGDCPAKLAIYGDAWNPDMNPRCHINRELTKDQIKAFLNSSNSN